MKGGVARRLMAAVVAASMVAGVSSPAYAVTVEELQEQIQRMQQQYESRIAQLERRVEELQQGQATAGGTGSSAGVAPTTVAAGTESEFPYVPENPSGFGNVTVGGYADVEFMNFENRNSAFDQHRFIVNVGAKPTDRITFYSEYEIEHGGTDAAGGGEAKVEQAWLDYKVNDLLALRGGIVLMPMGKFNILHDSDLQDLTIRPLMMRRVVPSTWEEAGVGLHGELPVGEWLGEGMFQDVLVNYQGYVVNGLDEDISDSGLRNAKGDLGDDGNNNKALVGRLGISPVNNLEVGFSGYAGRYGRSGSLGTANGRDDIAGFAADLDFRMGPFELVGDFARFDFDEGALVDHDNSDATAPLIAPGRLQGFYIEPRWHFWPEFLNGTFLGRGFEGPTFTLVGRYDWVENRDDGDSNSGDNEEERLTLGLNYRPIESFVIKTEYQWNTTKHESLEYGDDDGVAVSMALGF